MNFLKKKETRKIGSKEVKFIQIRKLISEQTVKITH